jgi:hypothetical protein
MNTASPRRLSLAFAFAATAALLAGCGGGGSSAPAPAPLDVTGIWLGDESASGGAAGLMLSVNGMAYGYQTQGSTVRYFKGTDYSSDGTRYSFATSRYDEGTADGAVTDSRTGSLTGQFVSGSSGTLLVSFSSTPAPGFVPMHLDLPAASVSAQIDLRDFAGSYPMAGGGTLTLSANSASSGVISGTGIGGCDVGSGQGAITRPRADRNVWIVTLLQTGCAVPARDGQFSSGLATLYLSGTTHNLAIISFDNAGWTVVSSSR